MKRFLLKIYFKLPVVLQDIAVSIYGLLLYQQRYTGIYKKYLKKYAANTHENVKREIRIQNLKFLYLLHYAAAASPFYKELYKDINLNQIKSVEDIGMLPILTKEMLRENIDRIYTIPKRKSLIFFTGGTTGIPLKVRKRKKDVRKRMAYLDAYKLTFGFRNNRMKSARFFGKKIVEENPRKPIFWRNNYVSRQRLYSTYHLTEENLAYYVADLNRYKPASIDGFVSAIYCIARYMENNGIKPSFTPKAVFTTSETVLPYHRETIERVFGCSLSDQYASNEGAPFIVQCRCGSYHEAIDTGVFEHLERDGRTRLLVTGFDTIGTPLIRYDIGDVILPLSGKKSCACDSCHPIIEGISGREAAFLMTGKGQISQVQLSVFISSLSKLIVQMQFIQKKDGSLHIIAIPSLEEKAKDLTKAYEQLYLALRDFLGGETNIVLEYRDSPYLLKSGKFQLILKEEWLEK